MYFRIMYLTRGSEVTARYGDLVSFEKRMVGLKTRLAKGTISNLRAVIYFSKEPTNATR